MKYLIYTLLILVLLSVNMQLDSLFFYTPVRLNLLVLPAVFAAMEKKAGDYLFISFLSGLFLDFYSAAPFGSFILSFILAASLLGWASKNLWTYDLNFKSLFLFSAAGILLVEILVIIFAQILPAGIFSPDFSLKSVGLKAALNFFGGLLALLPCLALWRFTLKVISKIEPKIMAPK